MNDITVQWYDHTIDKLPAELKHLSAVLEDRMKTRCSVHPGQTQRAPELLSFSTSNTSHLNN
jgi:hypothetical protein